MKKEMKRILAILLTITFIFSSNVAAFAFDNSINEVEENIIPMYTLYPDYVIKSESGIGKGTVQVTVHLDQAYEGIAFRVGATGNPNSTVSCSVQYPDGRVRVLGNSSIYADGSYMNYAYDINSVPAGNYVFKFKMSDTTNYTGCIATIYKAGIY